MDQPSHSSLLGRLRADLSGLEACSQLRHLQIVPEINFCSNDYLGLSTDPRLAEALTAAISAGNRVASTGLRLLSGHATVWGALENQFAEFAGTEAALYFNSGYAANTGLFGCVRELEDIVFSDSANHASIIDGIRLSGARKVIFPHFDLNILENELRRAVPGRGHKFIAVESVFSMNGDRAPMADLLALAERYGAELIVDEAHATGVLGPHGCGLVAEAGAFLSVPLAGAFSSAPLAGATQRVLAVVHTCGKALAGVGAFIACSGVLKRYLINHARPFIFSTALPPYIAAQLRAAMRIAAAADAERALLQKLAAHLRSRLRENGFDTAGSDSQIVPVILGDNERALTIAARLCEDGFAVLAIRPPTVPPGTARLRISLTVKHTTEMLDGLTDSLVRAHAHEKALLVRNQAG